MYVQVDSMVKESGVFHMKTDQEREIEKRVKERQQELMEIYRAQKVQREETKASQHLGDARPHRSSGGHEEYATSTDRRKERNGLEDRVGVSQLHDRFNADQQLASHYEREVTSNPSLGLNSGKT